MRRSKFKIIFISLDKTKTYHERANLASIFREILIFSLTKNTKKKGSGATLGILGKEKLKFAKKTPPTKNYETKLPIHLFANVKKMLYNLCMIKETINISKNFNNALILKSAGVSFMLLSLTIMFNMFIKLFPVTARA